MALVIVVGLLVVPLTVRADTEKPGWKAGNYWVYQGNIQTLPGGNGDAKMRLDVLGTETLKIGSTSYDAYHLRLAVNTTVLGTPFDVPGEVWYRTSDLALLKLRMSMTLNFGSPVTMNITLTTGQPMAINWPLKAGATWSVSSPLTLVLEFAGNSQTQTQTISGTVEVGPSENVTVAAGKFETNPLSLKTSDGNETRSYWSSDAGNSVREEAYNSSGAKTGSSDLTSYSYSKPSGIESQGLTILGFAWYVWIVVIVAAAAGVASALAVRRRRKPAAFPPAPMPATPTVPSSPPPELGPPGQPPLSPP